MNSMEESLIFANLCGVKHQERSQAVRSILQSVRQSGGKLRFSNTRKLFSLLSELLYDTHWQVRNDVLDLLAEVVGKLTGETAKHAEAVLPALISCLGDTKQAIRKQSGHVIEVCNTDFRMRTRNAIQL